jgi:hypothetical protein
MGNKESIYKIQIVAYADINLVEKATGVLKETIINISKTVEKVGLAINLQETKYMEVT